MARKRDEVGGPVPLSVATESVLFGGILDKKMREIAMLGTAVALAWWITTRKG
jgi:hypothetical protein